MRLAGLEKVLVIGASADSSTKDVETGWLEALTHAGYSPYLYSLRNRLKMWTDIIAMLKGGLNCRDCGSQLKEPVEHMSHFDQITVMQAASECAVHEAIRSEASWVLIISGCSLHPNAAAMLQKLKLPVVTVVTESPYNDKDMLDLAKVSTIVGVNDMASVSHFKKHSGGGSALYLPTAFTRSIHTPGKADPDKASDVFFCGTGFDERAALFGAVNWEGIDFKLAGFWPTNQSNIVVPDAIEERLGQVKIGYDARLAPFVIEGLLDNRDTVEWYRAAKIVLSVHRQYDGSAWSLGPRVYETAAVGAFQIIDDRRPEVFEIFGDSIPRFRADDSEHLEWTIRYWLARPDQRAAKAAEAQKLVQDHSYDNRLARLEDYIIRMTTS